MRGGNNRGAGRITASSRRRRTRYTREISKPRPWLFEDTEDEDAEDSRAAL